MAGDCSTEQLRQGAPAGLKALTLIDRYSSYEIIVVFGALIQSRKAKWIRS